MRHAKEHKKIGHWLEAKRLEAGLSKVEVAALLNCDPSFVEDYEAGQRLDIVQFTKITLALNANPNEAFVSCVADL